MVNCYYFDFFSQKAAIFLDIPFKHKPYLFLREIKKKLDVTRGKISQGKSLSIQFSIEDQLEILEVLQRN